MSLRMDSTTHSNITDIAWQQIGDVAEAIVLRLQKGQARGGNCTTAAPAKVAATAVIANSRGTVAAFWEDTHASVIPGDRYGHTQTCLSSCRDSIHGAPSHAAALYCSMR